jgi:RNA polymerase sigma-B factor
MTDQAQNRKLYERKAGDDSVRQELIEANLGWTQKLANEAGRYYKHHDPEDIYQVACMGLMTAVDRWDREKGTLNDVRISLDSTEHPARR